MHKFKKYISKVATLYINYNEIKFSNILRFTGLKLQMSLLYVWIFILGCWIMLFQLDMLITIGWYNNDEWRLQKDLKWVAT